MSWESRRENPFVRRIYALDGGFAVWHEAMGWFLVDPQIPSIAVPASAEQLRREERIWGLPAALCVFHGDDLALHGAAVDVGGSAILFCAPGRFGKTTIAAAFVRAGHRLLADDMSGCRLDPVPAVMPGPSVLRIRRDVYERLRFPTLEPVAEDEDKVHLMLGESERGSADAVPVAGIVFVRQASLRGSEGRPEIDRVQAAEALPNLWAVNFSLPTTEARERTFRKAARLTDVVPAWEAYRPRTFEDLPRFVDLIVSTCLPGG
jgi:hypothetical protein